MRTVADNRTILVIDDFEALLPTIAETLANAGLDVVTAANGPDGLASARAKKPACVVCDRHMPEMGGVEILQALRQCRETPNIPFVFFTYDIDDALRDVAEAHGACVCLEKPDKISRLPDAVRQAIADA